MASAVDICNKALSLLGQSSIVSLDDQTPEALACRIHFEPLVKRVLRDHRWNCVKARAALNRLVETPPFGFKYYYQLPSKCLIALELDNGDYFEIEGRRLLTDSSAANLHFIEFNTDTTVFDPQLADAMAHFLASELAPQMTSSSSEAQRLHNLASEKLADAKASDAFEGKQRQKRGNRLLSAKYNGN